MSSTPTTGSTISTIFARHFFLLPCVLMLLLMLSFSQNSVAALPQFSSQLRRYAQAPIQNFLDAGIVDGGGVVNTNDPFYRAARENGVKWMRFGKRAPSHGKWMRFGKRAPSQGKWMRFGKRAEGGGGTGLLDDYYMGAMMDTDE